jgi:uncharacterized membrane protein YGL010W
MRKIDLLFAEYAESHRNSTNKLIHWICVPLIFWTILGFISIIPSKSIGFRYIGEISYKLCSHRFGDYFLYQTFFLIGLIMFFVMILMESFAYGINIRFEEKSWMVYLAVFVITWIFQFVGHKIEGKKPSFLKDLQFLLVGPIWLLSFILKKLGIRY